MGVPASSPLHQPLLQYGAFVNYETKNGYTALIWAAEMGHVDVIRSLCADCGARVDYEATMGRTALIAAAAVGSVASLDALIKQGANVDYESLYRTTALTVAAEAGQASARVSACPAFELTRKPKASRRRVGPEKKMSILFRAKRD